MKMFNVMHPRANGYRVGMVVFSYYLNDPRVRREAEALAAAGWRVDVLCLRKPGELRSQRVNGVAIYRLPVERKRGNIARYLWEYASFLFLAFLRISALHFKKGYDVIHVHNMPDVLVLAGLIPRAAGAKVILDLHDPMPEVFMTKYGMGYDHKVIRLLRFLEKWSIRFSHLVLTPNKAFKDLFVSRGCPKEKIHVVMNSPDPAIFQKDNGTATPITKSSLGQTHLMYHGTIVERHGLDTALEALALVRHKISNPVFHVVGDGDFVIPFKSLVSKFKLNDIVQYHGQVSLEVIAASIANIDVGIIPNKRSVFTEINFPTRIFEYLAKGKPVVAPKTRGITDYFDDTEIEYFEPGNAQSLADAILRACAERERTAATLRKGLKVYERWAWPCQRRHFLEVYAALTGNASFSSVTIRKQHADRS